MVVTKKIIGVAFIVIVLMLAVITPRIVKAEQAYNGYYFQFAKEWAGDEVNLDNVDVTFKVGDFSWKLGDKPVPVKPGQTLEPISETVTGLPENCEYTSDLPTSYTVPEYTVPEYEEDVRSSAVNEYGETYTLTTTNTVKCEEETPQVLGQTASTPKPVATTQVTSTPVGGVSAGVGSSSSNSTALFGLFGSILALGAGIVRKVTM